MEYRAVVFDLFGTLTRAVRRSSWHQRMALALGCDLQALTGLLDETFALRARGGDGRLEMRRLAWRLGRRPTAAQVTEALRLRERAVRSSIQLRRDAMATLWALRRQELRLGLISDCTEDLPRIMARLPVNVLFDATVYSAHLGLVKPHPSLYLTACHRLGVEPGECLYVGDGGGQELSGARAVGMTAVRLDAPDLARHLTFAAEADWSGLSVTSLSQVLDLVRPGPSRDPRTTIPRPSSRDLSAAVLAGSYLPHGGADSHPADGP